MSNVKLDNLLTEAHGSFAIVGAMRTVSLEVARCPSLANNGVVYSIINAAREYDEADDDFVQAEALETLGTIFEVRRDLAKNALQLITIDAMSDASAVRHASYEVIGVISDKHPSLITPPLAAGIVTAAITDRSQYVRTAALERNICLFIGQDEATDRAAFEIANAYTQNVNWPLRERAILILGEIIEKKPSFIDDDLVARVRKSATEDEHEKVRAAAGIAISKIKKMRPNRQVECFRLDQQTARL